MRNDDCRPGVIVLYLFAGLGVGSLPFGLSAALTSGDLSPFRSAARPYECALGRHRTIKMT